MCLDLEYSFYQNKNDKEKNNDMKKVMNLHFTSLISENVTILGNREGGGVRKHFHRLNLAMEPI